MREFVKSIVGNNYMDFKYKDFNFLFVEQEYHSYYLFCFPMDRVQLVNLQKESGNIFRTIKESKIYHLDMDKNITCILCLCVEENEYYEAETNGKVSDLGKIICLVEEDLNYFKKNVLLYTKRMEEFAQNNIGKLDFLCQEYFTEYNFQNYKNSYRKNAEYDFLINLFIKIPFLSFYGYQPGNHKKYQSMETFIDNVLVNRQIDCGHIDEMCGKLEENLDDENMFFKWIDTLLEVPANKENTSKEEKEDED